MIFTKARARTVAAAALAGATVVALTGCDSVQSLVSPDRWAVTYRVEVVGADHGRLTDVTYLDAVELDDPEEQHLPEVTTTPDPDHEDAAVWVADAVILAEDPARIVVTPPAEAIATCSILLDGTESIAEGIGDPGSPVECAATTPTFP